ncbi:MAG: hypothetical protein IT581_04915 [Verrucomicrobiales bacterium]|nr:hypothetical protein [Verrucomicrobiales bacterium]
MRPSHSPLQPEPRCRSAAISQGWLALILLLAPAAIALAATGTGVAADADGQGSSSQWFDFLGAFHIVALHYPIGFVTGAFLLEAYNLIWPSAELRRVNRMVLALSFVSGVVAAVFGLFRGWDDEFDAETVNMHRNLAFTMVGLTLFAWITAVLSARSPQNKGLLYAYRGLVLAAMLVLIPAGHYGGNLTHGSEFLTANAPPIVAKMLRKQPAKKIDASAKGKAEVSEGDALFTAKIAPIFESRCYSCHGPEKHKGDYRLDQKESAFKGGESKSTAITPGDLLKSELVRRILLPSEHDDAMPPEGKKPLTPEEVLLIAHWIQGGAPFVERAAPATDATAAKAPPGSP